MPRVNITEIEHTTFHRKADVDNKLVIDEMKVSSKRLVDRQPGFQNKAVPITSSSKGLLFKHREVKQIVNPRRGAHSPSP